MNPTRDEAAATPSDRLAEELSTFGGHVVDGLEAVRDLVLAAVEDSTGRVRDDLRIHDRRLEKIESLLLAAGELGVAEAERLGELAVVLRELGHKVEVRPPEAPSPFPPPSRVGATLPPSLGGLNELHERAEALTIAVRDDVLSVFDDVQKQLQSVHLQLEGLREEVEALREELDAGAGPAASADDARAEISRLATEVRLLRRRLQVQDGDGTESPGVSSSGVAAGPGARRRRRAGQ